MRARLRVKLELQTPLGAFGARLHPHLGHAFGDGWSVDKTCDVTD